MSVHVLDLASGEATLTDLLDVVMRAVHDRTCQAMHPWNVCPDLHPLDGATYRLRADMAEVLWSLLDEAREDAVEVAVEDPEHHRACRTYTLDALTTQRDTALRYLADGASPEDAVTDAFDRARREAQGVGMA